MATTNSEREAVVCIEGHCWTQGLSDVRTTLIKKLEGSDHFVYLFKVDAWKKFTAISFNAVIVVEREWPDTFKATFSARGNFKSIVFEKDYVLAFGSYMVDLYSKDLSQNGCTIDPVYFYGWDLYK